LASLQKKSQSLNQQYSAKMVELSTVRDALLKLQTKHVQLLEDINLLTREASIIKDKHTTLVMEAKELQQKQSQSENIKEIAMLKEKLQNLTLPSITEE
jgi:predicted  nucleic acid-binding Zn-ribbon protein